MKSRFLGALGGSRLVPRSLLLVLARRSARNRSRRILEADRGESVSAAGSLLPHLPPLYLIDALHGSTTFWDWIGVRGGGLWYNLLWPLTVETALRRVLDDSRLRIVLEIDGQTFEEMADESPRSLDLLKEALATGRVEIVNGTYSQPLAMTIGGESWIRQFYYGLAAIREATGANVESFLTGEPQFFPQLPQLLAGFGFRSAVLRTHWAAFGSDPALDATFARWQAPDGSAILIVPRYSFMGYGEAGGGLAGLSSGGIEGSDFESWDNGRLERFRGESAGRGIASPLIVRLADPNPAESPFPRVAAVAARQDVQLTTPREYVKACAGESPTVSYGPDDFPNTVPWGLGGGRLQRDVVDGEGSLLLAERLDALAYAMGRASDESKLETAWKQLLKAQHHDLHLCGPWLSRKHGLSMAEVGQRMAVESRRVASEVAQAAAAYLASYVDSSNAEGRALVLFNPSSWPRQEYFEFTLRGGPARVYQAGQEVAAQVVGKRKDFTTIGFVAALPPLGYRLFDLRFDGAPEEAPEPLPSDTVEAISGGISFHGSFYSADVNPSIGLRLNLAGRTLAEGAYMTVWRDGQRFDSREGTVRADVLQHGPVFDRYRAEGKLGDFSFCQWTTLYRMLPRVDFRLEFDFGAGAEFGPQLPEHTSESPYFTQDWKKLCFNVTSNLSHVFADSPFLVSDSAADRLSAMTLFGFEDGLGSGIALLNRGTPGHHFERDQGLLKNVLAWSPKHWPYASDNSVSGGKSRYTRLSGGFAYECSLAHFTSRLNATRAAIDHRVPCLGVLLSPRHGSLPSEGSFIRLEPSEALLSALFVRKNAVYARLWNASSSPQTASLVSGGPLSLRQCPPDLSSESPADDLTLQPWGLMTLRLAGPSSR